MTTNDLYMIKKKDSKVRQALDKEFNSHGKSKWSRSSHDLQSKVWAFLSNSWEKLVKITVDYIFCEKEVASYLIHTNKILKFWVKEQK